MTPQYVTDFLQKRTGLLDGVVISGGEPTLQSDLIPFIKMIRDLGYQVKLDTNGSFPGVVEEILKLNLCDYFAVDYKAPAEHYPKICGLGADARKVIRTIQLLAESGVPFEVRTTVIPQLGSTELAAMAKELPAVPRYVLNRYRVPDKYLPRDEERIMARPLSPEEIRSLSDNLTAWQPNITL
jgi:pyruvate formate lyase activating enzyme